MKTNSVNRFNPENINVHYGSIVRVVQFETIDYLGDTILNKRFSRYVSRM